MYAAPARRVLAPISRFIPTATSEAVEELHHDRQGRRRRVGRRCRHSTRGVAVGQDHTNHKLRQTSWETIRHQTEQRTLGGSGNQVPNPPGVVNAGPEDRHPQGGVMKD